jgi:hypothetical protein
MQSQADWSQSERASRAIGVASRARITRMACARRIAKTLAHSGGARQRRIPADGGEGELFSAGVRVTLAESCCHSSWSTTSATI